MYNVTCIILCLLTLTKCKLLHKPFLYLRILMDGVCMDVCILEPDFHHCDHH